MKTDYEIKREPEDFVVEEITPDGKVLELGKEWKFDEKSEGDQLVCVLEKKNWDTNLAVKRISEALHVSRKRVGFAGTKDKRAVSTQRISLWKIKENVRDLRLKDIQIKPLYYSNERVELGDLQGNRFTLKVYSKKKPKLSKDKKIPNLFGVQRFGETRPITHLVGREILRGDLENAVKIYLAKVFPAESKEAKQARKKLAETWDYDEAMRYFPYGLRFERTMIAHLAQHSNDYAGALRKLPKFLKLMFVHAYQSFLFNKFLEAVLKNGKKYAKLKTGPLYGTETLFENELEKKVLEREGVSLKDFVISSMPEMSSRGERRALFVVLKDFKVLEKGSGFCTVRFSLPKGCYATTVIDYLFSA